VLSRGGGASWFNCHLAISLALDQLGFGIGDERLSPFATNMGGYAAGLRGPALDISTGRAISGSLPTATESHGPRSGPERPPVYWSFFGADGFLLEDEVIPSTSA
jgi:hypothetical protein